jgi:hypothetical protein
MSFHNVFGGTIEQKEPDAPEYAHEIRPREFITVQGEIVATIKCYLSDDDVVREYYVRGVTGEIRQWEPSFEDRKFINAQIIAELLVGQGIDMHDFKEILELAQDGWLFHEDRADHIKEADEMRDLRVLADKISNVHHELGGME